MMRIQQVLGAAAVAFVVAAVPVFAHHSVSSEFDTKNCRDFTGTLTSVSWQNPHMHFQADVKDASGKVESWQFQGYSTLTMTRAGTSRQDFLDNVGKEISVRGCLARSGTEHKAAAGVLKLSDGRQRQVGQLQDNN
jgi:hypothetical protein